MIFQYFLVTVHEVARTRSQYKRVHCLQQRTRRDFACDQQDSNWHREPRPQPRKEGRSESERWRSLYHHRCERYCALRGLNKAY